MRFSENRGDACCFKAGGNLKENAKPFSFFAGRLGQVVLQTETQSATFDYDGYSDKWATDFNAIAPDARRIPCLSALAMRDGDQSICSC